jgi:hypothetical protein
VRKVKKVKKLNHISVRIIRPGAFHLTEIWPEILLENQMEQMEHVNFWNAVSKLRTIPRRCPQIGNSGSFEIFTSIKTFPNHVAGSRPFQCLESGFISPNVPFDFQANHFSRIKRLLPELRSIIQRIKPKFDI